jgi:hypothetical protein
MDGGLPAGVVIPDGKVDLRVYPLDRVTTNKGKRGPERFMSVDERFKDLFYPFFLQEYSFYSRGWRGG